MITVRTYRDKVLLQQSSHRKLERALDALNKRTGDAAVLLAPELGRTVWFTGTRDGKWVTDRTIYYTAKETASA